MQSWIALRGPYARRMKMELAIDFVQRLPILESAGVGMDVKILFVFVVLLATASRWAIIQTGQFWLPSVALQERSRQ